MGKKWVLGMVVILLGVTTGYASEPFQGTLTAKTACPAYNSIKNKTNPGDVKLTPGTGYAIFEVNKPDYDAVRIKVEGAVPSERWVEKGCGEVTGKMTGGSGSGGQAGGGGSSGGGGASCHTADQEDSYVLALSWQPAFCETHEDKTECKTKDPATYQASHFTLHGLWPNKNSCGIDYNYCDKAVTSRPSSMCAYPQVTMNKTTADALSVVMPGDNPSSCLERHEWWKHGTCSGMAVDPYYQLATRFVQEFNGPDVAALMGSSSNKDKTITMADFQQAVEKTLGAGSFSRMQLKCTNGQISDIQINLPANLTATDTLKAVAAQGKEQGRGNCGDSFIVDSIAD